MSRYDELLALSPDPARDDPAAVLSRAVAVGHVLGPSAGLLEVDQVEPVLGDRYRVLATRAYLLRLAGDLAAAAECYARAAARCPSTLERDHLVRESARARAAATGPSSAEEQGDRTDEAADDDDGDEDADAREDGGRAAGGDEEPAR